MELGLFVRNFQASSNGSSAIARRQFLSALTLLSARNREPGGLALEYAASCRCHHSTATIHQSGDLQQQHAEHL
jgi:hypothetical protein